MQMVADLRLGVSTSPLRTIASSITYHRIFRSLESVSVDLVPDFLAKRQVMATDWSASGCTLWLPYC